MSPSSSSFDFLCAFFSCDCSLIIVAISFCWLIQDAFLCPQMLLKHNGTFVRVAEVCEENLLKRESENVTYTLDLKGEKKSEEKKMLAM